MDAMPSFSLFHALSFSVFFLLLLLWYLLFGNLSIREKAVKSWAENENQVQNHYDNYCFHKEELEEEEEEDVVPQVNQLLLSFGQTNPPP